MRIFLDANVLFAAAATDGVVRRLMRELREAGHECWLDTYVLDETRRNLAAKRPSALPDLDRLVGELAVAEASPNLPVPVAAQVLPLKDQPVLAAAMRLGCTALVTGDRAHFGPFYGQTLGGVAIHYPRSLAAALLS